MSVLYKYPHFARFWLTNMSTDSQTVVFFGLKARLSWVNALSDGREWNRWTCRSLNLTWESGQFWGIDLRRNIGTNSESLVSVLQLTSLVGQTRWPSAITERVYCAALLSVLLYQCEMWSLKLKHICRLLVFDRTYLRNTASAF